MELDVLREKITELDLQIMQLLDERFGLTKQVGLYKKNVKTSVLNKERENQILELLSKTVAENQLEVKALYKFLLEISRLQQSVIINSALEIPATELDEKYADTKNIKVACLGGEGSFSHIATQKAFEKAQIVLCDTFFEVEEELKNNRVDYAVVPTNNSTAGMVFEIYDILVRNNFYITHRFKQKISHALVGKHASKFQNGKTVCSHPQAIAQCKEFINANAVQAIPEKSTATACKVVAETSEDIFAISSEECAKKYGLKIFYDNIQDHDFNYTSFAVLTNTPNATKNNQRVSIIVSLPHEKGALNKLLTKFDVLGFNLTKIESRPIEKTDFEFRFFLDFEGNTLQEDTLVLLQILKTELPDFKFIGCY